MWRFSLVLQAFTGLIPRCEGSREFSFSFMRRFSSPFLSYEMSYGPLRNSSRNSVLVIRGFVLIRLRLLAIVRVRGCDRGDAGQGVDRVVSWTARCNKSTLSPSWMRISCRQIWTTWFPKSISSAIRPQNSETRSPALNRMQTPLKYRLKQFPHFIPLQVRIALHRR